MMHSFDDVFDEMFDAAFGRSLKMVPTAKGVEKKYCVPSFPPCKPSIIILKGIEQYLGIPFSKTATLAGYSKEDLRIDFERSSLILGTTEDYKEPVEDDTGTVIASNIKFPSFRYAYSIPISLLDIEKTEAKFENGLLFISIPPLKAEEKKRPVVVIK